MTKEKLYRKTVHIQGLDILNMKERDLIPRRRNMEIKHHQIDKKNKETYTTFLSQDKQQINNALADLKKNMLISDRVRTINNVPKYRIINTTMVKAN